MPSKPCLPEATCSSKSASHGPPSKRCLLCSATAADSACFPVLRTVLPSISTVADSCSLPWYHGSHVDFGGQSGPILFASAYSLYGDIHDAWLPTPLHTCKSHLFTASCTYGVLLNQLQSACTHLHTVESSLLVCESTTQAKCLQDNIKVGDKVNTGNLFLSDMCCVNR